MKRNALLTLVCCLLMGVFALVAAPRTALAIPYHAADAELQGTAYAVLSPTTGELDFIRSTETHEDLSTGTVTSISGGTYTGTIFTGFENLSRYRYPSWEENKSVKSVRFVDAVRPTSTYRWFYYMTGCTTIDPSHLDTSKVDDMNYMFYNCWHLTSLNVSSFDTSKVDDMSFMFSFCPLLLSLDVSGFDTSAVSNMSGMFESCSSLTSLDISSFDTSKVTNMYRMFDGCRSLKSLDLSSFDTSKVITMKDMFYGCNSLNKITFGDKFVIN